jgi:hypothetical protein
LHLFVSGDRSFIFFSLPELLNRFAFVLLTRHGHVSCAHEMFSWDPARFSSYVPA